MSVSANDLTTHCCIKQWPLAVKSPAKTM